MLTITLNELHIGKRVLHCLPCILPHFYNYKRGNCQPSCFVAMSLVQDITYESLILNAPELCSWAAIDKTLVTLFLFYDYLFGWDEITKSTGNSSNRVCSFQVKMIGFPWYRVDTNQTNIWRISYCFEERCNCTTFNVH